MSAQNNLPGHELNYASPVSNETPQAANVVLVIGTAVYLLLNAFGLMLVIRGEIMPPWGMLGFFSICPIFLIILVSCIRIAVRMNLALLIAFAVVMLFAAAFNAMLMGEAIASV